ncbi:MAG TPA: glycosyltransferase family 39 protein [Caldilineaceae bacterium]|nr:glycosyltransferase family 39 protein [Caldilineaceae bacterium]
MKTKISVTILVAALAAHGILLWWPNLLAQAIAALTLTGLLPGYLVVALLLDRVTAAPTPSERLLYSLAAGYLVMVVGSLLLSYLPGGLATWQIYAGFDGILLLLLVIHQWRGEASVIATATATSSSVQQLPLADDTSAQRDLAHADLLSWPARGRTWLMAGLLVLAIGGALLRFPNLGYAEYHGDEARAALRAAAVIQGYEDVLLIHKKGPTEILLPTIIYSLSNHLTETTSRLPFAVAGFAAIFAIWLLGWRLFGPLAGFIAAFLLMFDGYYIGFARIVQYQSIVILMTACVVLILHRLTVRPVALTRYLLLAALLLATGLFSHYEAILAVVPATYLLGVLLYRYPPLRTKTILATTIAGASGVGVLALFYVPFLLHPQFSATLTYLTERRIGLDLPGVSVESSFPYNNLADYFLRSTVYNTTYYEVLRIVVVVGALILLYARLWGRRTATLLGAAVIVVLTVAFVRPALFVVGGTDTIFLFFTLALLPALLAFNRPTNEHLLWLWFGLPFLFALFFTVKPRTHIYIFFTPWMLLVGMSLQRVEAWLRQRWQEGVVRVVGVSLGALGVVLFGTYAYYLFIYNQVEVLRLWDTEWPAGYWTAYEQPDHLGMFGFPLAAGWKVAGALYGDGTIVGDYENNEDKQWGPMWYTRGERQCERTADWFFETSSFEPVSPERYQTMMENLALNNFKQWGVVTIHGQERMTIYRRAAEDEAFAVRTLPLEAYETQFDWLTTPDLFLTYPVVNPPISHPLHINLNDQIWLEGYDIAYPQPLQPGDIITLTLYWRAQRPIETSYTVFNQSFYGNGTMVAQLDNLPVCGRRETWQWDPGELITDIHEIPVKADAPDGLYPLYTGMYQFDSGERLRILDEAGNRVADWVHLTDIRIGEE